MNKFTRSLLIFILTFFLFFRASAENYSDAELVFVRDIINYAKQYSAKSEIKDEDITAGILKGALEKIDAHSTYYTKEEYAKLAESLSGSFSGIGIYIDSYQGVIRVIGVIKGMPAEKAGLKNGDYITHINSQSTFGMSIDEASSFLKGRKGTKVKVEVFRKDIEKTLEKPLEFEIVRDNIEVEAVSSQKIDDILVVTISTFNEKTFDELLKSLQKYETYSGIILDLRSNPGGILESAIAISSLFVEKNSVIVQVSAVEKMKKDDEYACVASKKNCRKIRYSLLGNNIAIYNDDEPFISKKIPVTVLVNSYSASASEITALALQENSRAMILGQKTFGKGSVQTITPLKDGEKGALKLTTALYYSPKGNSIQADGVKPDVTIPELEIKKQEKRKDFFPSKEANYKNHIKLDKQTTKVDNKTEEKVEKFTESVEPNTIEDFAIQAAISSIKTSIKHNGNNN